MNSFNSTKNQVVRNTESPEGGSGQINGTTELNPSDLVNTELEAQEGEVKEFTIGESNEILEEDFDTLIEQTASNIEVSNTIPFEVDSETGLSLQGKQIEDLKTQLTALENDEATKLAISTEIEANRAQTREVLKTRQEKYKSIREGINTKIQATINQSNQTNLSIEDFISGNEALQAKVTELDQTIISAQAALDAFDAETSAQVEQSIQARKTELQQQLVEAQTNYTESGAEANDGKLLLEISLKESLTEPNKLFSEQNIQQVLATYGLQEGLERLQQLRTESNEAREQADRDEIQADIISRAYLYNNNPDLANVINLDIEDKLKTLQQQNPDSNTISRALELKNVKDRLEYLTNSGDTQLQELAFWFTEGRGNKTEAEILAKNSNFAKYVDQQIDNIYSKQQQDIKEGRLGGQIYLGSQADRQLQQEIDTRIEVQLDRAKTEKLQALRTELTTLQSDENGASFDSLDQSMSVDRDNLKSAEIEKFQEELAKALEAGRVKFEKGTFSLSEDIPSQNQEINQELSKLLDTTKPLLDMAGYAIQSLDGLSEVLKTINQDKERAENKLFGRGKKQAVALERLAGEVLKVVTQYTNLQTEKQSNITKFQESNTSLDNLKQAYNKLPKSIQDKLSAIENPTLDTITQSITTGVEEIQNYQTPPEITERRQQIQSLESQITETEAITAPATQATT